MRYIILLGIFLIIRLLFFYLFPLPLHDGQAVMFTALLLEDPKVQGDTQTFHIRIGDTWQSTYVSITVPDKEDFIYGQTLEVIGNIKYKLLKNKKTVITVQNAKIKAKNKGFLPIFGSLRAKIKYFCENNFSQPHSGLLIGIIFGITSDLTYQTTRSFRITGLSHIVAASGMNVSLVAGFLFSMFSRIFQRQKAIGVSILGILAYVCVSGFNASIVRAGLMGVTAFSANFLGRQYQGFYVLILVAIGMLLYDPSLLINVGFQLSFLATIGILLLKPAFFSSSYLFDDLGTTLSAQLTTTPVILATFGQYSLLSLVANILVLWTIPLITVVGGLGIIMGLFFEPLGKGIVLLIIPLLWYIETVTKIFSMVPLTVDSSRLPVFFTGSYYTFLVGIFVWKKGMSSAQRGSDKAVKNKTASV